MYFLPLSLWGGQIRKCAGGIQLPIRVKPPPGHSVCSCVIATTPFSKTYKNNHRKNKITYLPQIQHHLWVTSKRKLKWGILQFWIKLLFSLFCTLLPSRSKVLLSAAKNSVFLSSHSAQQKKHVWGKLYDLESRRTAWMMHGTQRVRRHHSIYTYRQRKNESSVMMLYFIHCKIFCLHKKIQK